MLNHRDAINTFNAFYSGYYFMTTELRTCPFCDAKLVKSETFSTRTATMMIHDDTNEGEPCIMRGTVIALTDRPEDVERIRRWNRRTPIIDAAPDLLAAVVAYRKAVDAGVNADPAIWADAELKSRAAIAKAKPVAAEKPTPTFRTEFPDFDAATLPAIPDGFKDSSWHNDVCPSFLDEARQMQIFIDYADPKEREFPEGKRFRMHSLNEHMEYVDTIAVSDDWADILAAIGR